MYNPNCRCPHHKIAMLAGLLTWVSAVLFFWASFNGVAVWGFISDEYFQFTIVFALLGFGLMKGGMCKCCGRGMKGGMMGCSCKCGDCSGGKCDSRHSENHQNM